ncbi:hypothetical protein P8625_12085 [Tenacibaculum tangerinum]|uniref:Uncharacterized protein n=1 Tax=Tenacibaculum tangerinum TaxID=3038772 RepID=A0ABY8L019_9FLAO|nr:hypothetical protein [Tenacibaculum tangerinum]WGH74817.1 hypothetical protein P8625_12085 [Tenacibaculum tangerinum]
MIAINLISPEKYLNKSIESLEKFKLIKVEGTISSHDKTYSSNYFDKSTLLFCTKEFKSLRVSADNNDSIKSIFFSTTTKIGVESYEKLVEEYGLPSQMIKMEELKEVRNFSNDAYTSMAYESSTLNCHFEDNPLIITWDKQNFLLEIHMDYQKDISFISFRVK